MSRTGRLDSRQEAEEWLLGAGAGVWGVPANADGIPFGGHGKVLEKMVVYYHECAKGHGIVYFQMVALLLISVEPPAWREMASASRFCVPGNSASDRTQMRPLHSRVSTHPLYLPLHFLITRGAMGLSGKKRLVEPPDQLQPGW